MRCMAFAGRNFKEIMRDPLTLIFGAGFPVVLLGLLTIIQSNIPVSLFELDYLTPGIAVFGLSFIALFSGLLLAKDRTTSFLTRLYSSPLKAWEYVVGYVLPLLPLYVAQGVLCYAFAMILGMEFSVNMLLAIVVNLPVALMFIGIGILSGSVFNDKQVGGIVGTLLTNVSAWLSGIWFDLSLMGEGFKSVAYALPFANAVDLGRAVISGDSSDIWGHLAIVSAYALVIFAAAVIAFNRKMKEN